MNGACFEMGVNFPINNAKIIMRYIEINSIAEKIVNKIFNK